MALPTGVLERRRVGAGPAARSVESRPRRRAGRAHNGGRPSRLTNPGRAGTCTRRGAGPQVATALATRSRGLLHLVLDDPRQRLGLLDPGRDHLRGRRATNEVAGRVRFGEGLGEVDGVALSQLRHGVDAGDLEQVGVLRADAVDAIQVDAVDPLEDESVADARRLLELLATLFGGAPLEQIVGRSHSDGFELFGIDGADPLDIDDLHWILQVAAFVCMPGAYAACRALPDSTELVLPTTISAA